MMLYLTFMSSLLIEKEPVWCLWLIASKLMQHFGSAENNVDKMTLYLKADEK